MISSCILFFVFRAVSIEYFRNYGISLYPIFSSIKYGIFLHTLSFFFYLLHHKENAIDVQIYGSPVLETRHLCDSFT